ncbi:MAG: hypothetical protein ACOX9R_16150 [Armatimonadota bacterium]|jgi:hypothetical protein
MRDRLGLIVLGIAGLLLVAVIVLVLLSGGREEPDEGLEPVGPPVDGIAEDDDEPDGTGDVSDIEVSGTELTIREEGEVVWRASFGGEIELDEQQNVARATDVLWEFEGAGFEGLTLRAPLMRAAWDERRLHFSEGIVIEGEGGRLRFSSNTAEYQFDTKKVIGRGDVRFQRGSFYGRAEEVVVDNQLKVVRLKRGSLTRRQ